MERDLAEAEKLAAIGAMAARVAHEIRNPITAARSLSQLLSQEPTSPLNAEHADLITRELDRVERQVKSHSQTAFRHGHPRLDPEARHGEHMNGQYMHGEHTHGAPMNGDQRHNHGAESSAAPPVIMITAYGSERTAVEAMKRGAVDYLPKPFDNEELVLVVERALNERRLHRDLELLRQEVGERYRFHKLLGKSPAMQRVFDRIRKVADTDLTVLIRGPSGTGKELVANAIHYNSPRRKRPLVKVNCAAFSRDLVESELFGHEQGAFTGATRARQGKFEIAEGGLCWTSGYNGHGGHHATLTPAQASFLYTDCMATSTALVDQDLSSAEEYIEAVQSLLANGKAGAARHTAAEGLARFPDHPWLIKTNRIINPTRIVAKPSDAPSRTQEFAWLREHGARYRDCWVALLEDKLLASGWELEAVLQEVRARGLESAALVHRIT